MRRPALILLPWLLAACAGVQVQEEPRGVLSDAAFVAPSRPIDGDRIFDLSPSMQAYVDGDLSRRIKERGIQKGLLYGETAPERPLLVTKNPVTIPDLHATIFTAMGISPRTAFEVEKRPFYATQDGKGKPVRDLFA